MDHFDPSRPYFEPYGLTCVRWLPSPMDRPDHHNEIELNLMLSGSVDYLHGGRKLTFRSGQLIAFWASIPHQTLDSSADCEYFVVTIPLAWFLQFQLPKSFVQSLLRGEILRQSIKGMEAFERTGFTRWRDELASGTPKRHKILLLELEARLSRLAIESKRIRPTQGQGGRRASRSPLTDSNPAKVEQLARVVAQRYLEPLTANEIGEAVGLHPNYAMNLFKKTFGTTLVDYITHHRISHAQRLLITTNDKILDVALSSGFNSLSRFNEAFRRNCGCTPREYRKYQYS